MRSRIAFQRAGIHGRAGDVAAARADFELVMKRLDAFTDSERVSVLLTRGMLALQAVEPAEATDSFAEAARHAHELGLLDQEASATTVSLIARPEAPEDLVKARQAVELVNCSRYLRALAL